MSWSRLDSAERAAGAQFTDFQGARLPKGFGPLTQEWHAVRARAGLLDGRNRRLLTMTGADRSTFMQGMLSNDLSNLAAGEGTYAALLSLQGRLVSDLYVYTLPDSLCLDVPAARVEAVREALTRHIVADDVEFQPPSAQVLMMVEGPDAADLLAAAAGQRVDDLPPCHHRTLTIAGLMLRCVAVGQTGESGFRLLGRVDSAAPLWERLVADGAVPVGLDAVQVLRLEAGIPWHGIDMDEETLVMEVGLEGAVSPGKGCYLGQEVVERVAARGHVNRKLCGLRGDAESLPPNRALLTHNGTEVGTITSAAMSPALGLAIALGYVHRRACAPGTVVHALAGKVRVSLTVTTLPFYRSPSRTTRGST